jgi:hypothetical protein
MSEEEDDDMDIGDDFYKQLSENPDAAYIINEVAPLIDIHPKDGKGMKKMKLYLQFLTDIVLRQMKDFRRLIQAKTLLGEFDLDKEDNPLQDTTPPDFLYQ